MEEQWKALQEATDLEEKKRILLSMRGELKTPAQIKQMSSLPQLPAVLLGFLKAEDPKLRRQAVLLLGKLAIPSTLPEIFAAYEKESIRMIRPDYLHAMASFPLTEYLPALRKREQELAKGSENPQEKKHIFQELQLLRARIWENCPPKKHAFVGESVTNQLFLPLLPEGAAVLKEEFTDAKTKILSGGLLVETTQLDQILSSRLYGHLFFLLPEGGRFSEDPKVAAEEIAKPLEQFLRERHKGKDPFRCRIQWKGKGNAADRSRFISLFAQALEEASQGALLTTPSFYEVELRLLPGEKGTLRGMVQLFTLPEERFFYRQQVTPGGIRPEQAALLCALSQEYREENARVLDLTCEDGTFLVERQRACPKVNTLYGVSPYENAIAIAKENTKRAGIQVHLVHRNPLTFTHEEPFQEVFCRLRDTKELQSYLNHSGDLTKEGALLLLNLPVYQGPEKRAIRNSVWKTMKAVCLSPKTGEYCLMLQRMIQ